LEGRKREAVLMAITTVAGLAVLTMGIFVGVALFS
jgi:hypothetical protein